MEPPFNYFFNDRTNPITIEAVTGGPLAAALEAYAQRLHDDGYATHSGFLQLRVLGCFNHWLDREALTAGDVSLATIEQFLRGRRQRGKLRKGDAAALRRLLTMLDPNPFPVAVSSLTAIEVSLQQFQQYLRQERSLTEATVINYRISCRFLVTRCYQSI